MPTALSEDAGNADFGTGLAVPANGEDSADWGPLIISGFQQIADRTQALAAISGAAMSGGVATKKVLVPMGDNALGNSSSRFAFVFSSGANYWQQTDVTSAGKLTLEVPQLPIGATITGVYAWWANTNNTTLPVTTMPTLTLETNVYSAGAAADPGSYNSTVGTMVDATAVVATYKLMHKIALTGLAEVVAEDVVYRVGFAGEAGTNATTGGNLAAIYIELGVG